MEIVQNMSLYVGETDNYISDYTVLWNTTFHVLLINGLLGRYYCLSILLRIIVLCSL